MGRAIRVDVGGMVCHAVNRATFARSFSPKKRNRPYGSEQRVEKRFKSLDRRVTFETPGDPKRAPDTVTKKAKND